MTADQQNDDALVAEKHYKRAKKDTSLNLHISSEFLEEIKTVALSQGFEDYHVWAHMTLEMAVAEAHAFEDELKIALKEIGPIEPWWSDEDEMYVFEHEA